MRPVTRATSRAGQWTSKTNAAGFAEPGVCQAREGTIMTIQAFQKALCRLQLSEEERDSLTADELFLLVLTAG